MTDERSATPNDVRLGKRVRARRLELAMSQERLAELLGVTFQQVQKYEKGVNRIAVSRLIDIADALEQPAAQFLEGMGRAAAPQSAEALRAELGAVAECAQINRIMVTIRSAKVRRRLVEVCKAVAEERP